MATITDELDVAFGKPPAIATQPSRNVADELDAAFGPVVDAPPLVQRGNITDELDAEFGVPAAIEPEPESADSPRPVSTGIIAPAIGAIRRGSAQARQAASNLMGKTPDAESVAAAEREIEANPPSASYRAFTEAKSGKEAAKALSKDPIAIISQLLLESGTSSLKTGARLIPRRVSEGAVIGAVGGAAMTPEVLGAGAVVGLPVGAAAGYAYGQGEVSYALESSGKVLEALRESGVDITKPDELRQAFSDEAKMGEIREKAKLKGLAIGATDSLFNMLGGRIITKPARTIIGKLGQGAAELGVQATGDALGETAGQIVSGEEISAPSIMAEVAGGTGTAVSDVAVGAGREIAIRRQQAKDGVTVSAPPNPYFTPEEIESGIAKPPAAESATPVPPKATEAGATTPPKQVATVAKAAEQNAQPDRRLNRAEKLASSKVPVQNAHALNILVEIPDTPENEARKTEIAGRAIGQKYRNKGPLTPEEFTGVYAKRRAELERKRDRIGTGAMTPQDRLELALIDRHAGNERGLMEAFGLPILRGAPPSSPAAASTTAEGAKPPVATTPPPAATAGRPTAETPAGQAAAALETTEQPVTTSKPVEVADLTVKIETPAGSSRKPGWKPLNDHYGHIPRTEGTDGAPVDVFVKPGTPDEYTGPVFVVEQNKADGSFDEHKAILGYDTEEEARTAYLSNYPDDFTPPTTVLRMTQEEFKTWVHSDKPKKSKGAATDEKVDAADEIQEGVDGAAASNVLQGQADEVQGAEDARRSGLPAGVRDELRTLLNEYDNSVEMSEQELHERIADIADESDNAELKSVAAAYRTARADDRAEFGERSGEPETYGERLVDMAKAMIAGKVSPRPTAAPPAKTASPVDLSPIASAKTQDDLYAIGGKMLREATTDADVQAIQSAMKAWKPEAQPQKPAAQETPPGGTAAPGGDTPPESRDGFITSTKNSKVDQERADRGLPPMMTAARRSWGVVWDRAMKRIDDGLKETKAVDVRGDLVTDLAANPRATTDEENAILLHGRITEHNAFNQAAADVVSATAANDEAAKMDAQERMRRASDALQILDEVGKAVGTETGRGLAARRMMATEDYSLASMVTTKRAEANDGGPLTEAQQREVEKLHNDIKTKAEAFEKAETKAAQKEFDRILKEMESETRRKGKETSASKYVIEAAERVVARWDKSAESAAVALRKMGGNVGAGVDPTRLVHLAKMARAHIGHVGLDFAKWSQRMTASLGDLAAQYTAHFKEIFDAGKKLADDDLNREFGKGAKAGEQIKRRVKKQDGTQTPESITEKIKARAGDESPSASDIGSSARDLARHFISAGVKGRDNIIQAVHADLVKMIPSITPRETMDAISGYGKYKLLTKDAVSVELRDLSGQMQQIAKLRDMQAGRAPSKTGIERRVPSAEESRLQKLVNEAKKRGGYAVTDAATQLRTALQAAKKGVENRIRELETEISTRERIVKDKSELKPDTELAELRKRRDALQKEHDAIFGQRELTPEQKIGLAVSQLENLIDEYTLRIKEGRTSGGDGPSSAPWSARISELRAELDGIKERYANDPDLAIKRSEEATEKSIEEMEARIKAGGQTEQKTPATSEPWSPDLGKLKQRQVELRDQLKAMQKPKEMTDERRIEQAGKALDRAIADIEGQIKSGKVDKSPRGRSAWTPELSAKRATLEALREQRQELRDLANPKKTAEEKQLQSFKTRTARRIAELNSKLAAGDFTARARRELPDTPEVRHTRFELDQAKRRYTEGRLNDKLAKRTKLEKVGGAIEESILIARAVKTSFDLSAVLRQGAWVALGNPVRAAKAIPSMLRAFASKSYAHSVNEEILRRRNAPLYKQAKLFLHEDGSSLAHMEEAYMSRVADRIPGVGASQRAYTTFLNKLRADSFDAMAATLAKNGSATTEEARTIANYINVATGRGNLGNHETAARLLNKAFFSPRYVVSRFQLLGLQPFMRGNARTRKLIAKEYAKTLVGMGVVLTLGQAAGADVEWDPSDSDFMKLRFGRTRLDFMSGLSQTIVFADRTGENIIKVMRGEKMSMKDGIFVGRFLRSKLSPVFATMTDIATGTDFNHQTTTPGGVLKSMTLPMSFEDIYEVMKEQGVERGAALSLLAIFGMSLSTYGDKPRP